MKKLVIELKQTKKYGIDEDYVTSTTNKKIRTTIAADKLFTSQSEKRASGKFAAPLME